MEINKIKRIVTLVILVLSAMLVICSTPEPLVLFLIVGVDIGLIIGCLLDIARD